MRLYDHFDDIDRFSWRKASVNSSGGICCVILAIVDSIFVQILAMFARQRPALSHFLETLSFCRIIVDAYLYCCHRLASCDETLLPRRDYPSSWGAIQYA
jgi:hypothetical protein